MDKDEVLELVLSTLSSFINHNGIELQGNVSANQRLIGKSGIFDSMDLVNFLADLEENLEEKYDKSFSLQDERAMSRSHSPFSNPEELSKFIMELNAEDE